MFVTILVTPLGVWEEEGRMRGRGRTYAIVYDNGVGGGAS